MSLHCPYDQLSKFCKYYFISLHLTFTLYLTSVDFDWFLSVFLLNSINFMKFYCLNLVNQYASKSIFQKF